MSTRALRWSHSRWRYPTILAAVILVTALVALAIIWLALRDSEPRTGAGVASTLYECADGKHSIAACDRTAVQGLADLTSGLPSDPEHPLHRQGQGNRQLYAEQLAAHFARPSCTGLSPEPLCRTDYLDLAVLGFWPDGKP